MFVSLGISWVAGNAEELPIASESVDAYTIAFGIRNVTHVEEVGLHVSKKTAEKVLGVYFF